jgi:hypothetical protein
LSESVTVVIEVVDRESVTAMAGEYDGFQIKYTTPEQEFLTWYLPGVGNEVGRSAFGRTSVGRSRRHAVCIAWKQRDPDPCDPGLFMRD